MGTSSQESSDEPRRFGERIFPDPMDGGVAPPPPRLPAGVAAGIANNAVSQLGARHLHSSSMRIAVFERNPQLTNQITIVFPFVIRDGVKRRGILKSEFADPFFAHPAAQKFFCLSEEAAADHRMDAPRDAARPCAVRWIDANPEHVKHSVSNKPRHGTQ